MRFMNKITSREMHFDVNSITTSTITSIIASIIILLPVTASAENAPVLDISLPSIRSTAPDFLSEFKQEKINNNSSTLRLAFLDKPDNNIFSRFHDRYLTIHYGKTEKIKADYQHGAYCVSYEKIW